MTTMSSDRNSPPLASPTDNGRRRSSFAGQFVDMFGSKASGQSPANPPQRSGSIASAAMHAQQRRLSLTTVGLSGTTNGTSPSFTGHRPRAESLSSSNSGNVEESPFEEGDAPTSSIPASPFARRLSFGARAMRDMRTSTGNGNANGRPSVSKAARSPPTANNGRGQGYDFAENMRSRAERTSVSAASGMPNTPPSSHHRAKSVAVMEPPKEMPTQPKRPDAFQERILKGDFYYD